MGKIVDYTPKTVESEWAEDARELAALPEGKALVIEGNKGARTAFQRAARDEGITARLVETVETGEDSFEYTFIATPLRHRKSKAEAEADEVAETE